MIRVGLVSLGCVKNLVDSEIMLGCLRREGFEYIEDMENADVVIVNTCSFINDAKKESIAAIREAAGRKHCRRVKVVVAGCLAQRYSDELAALMPEVDAFVGLGRIADIAEIVREVVENDGGEESRCLIGGKPAFIPDYLTPRVRLTPKFSAYVKIAEGCNHGCAFCVIPRIRGRHRSRDESDIAREAEALVAGGCREINLVSQDSTYYGMDKWEEARASKTSKVDSAKGASLASLLRRLDAIEGDFWIRVLYTHPAHWSDELIDVFASCGKVVKYVDIPLQHASDRILESMRRETDGRYVRDLLDRIRGRIPDVAIRSTFITGFPGETREDFDILTDFISKSGIVRGGVFEFSAEEDTLAYGMSGRVHPSTRRKRRNIVSEKLYEIADGWGANLVGKKLRVIVEGKGVARTQWDAPEVDGTVEVDESLPTGEFADVEIEDSAGYSLFAKKTTRG